MSKVYRAIIKVADNFVPSPMRPLWNHPAGPKTIFFWAPAFKWCLVFAGLGDILNRPPDKISFPQVTSLALTGLIWSRYALVIVPALVLTSLDAFKKPLNKVSTSQSAALAATGLIWTRYCFVITPKNYPLALCNFLLGIANSVQATRAYMYQSSMVKSEEAEEEAQDD